MNQRFVLSLLSLTALTCFTNAQHPTCITDGTPEWLYTNCEVGGYNLPGNFDVARLDYRLSVLGIRGTGNVVADKFRPLPTMPSLKKVWFSNFNLLPEDPRFPFGDLFRHNRQVDDIMLINVKLITLTEEDFGGLSKLLNLRIQGASLEAVSPHAFRGTASLKYLIIMENYQLEGLDWSFLSPSSKTLETVYLNANSLKSQKLIRTSPFILSAAKVVSIFHNKLDRFPTAVYETLNPELPLDISIHGQRICPESSDCGCCEMSDFAKWMRDNKQIDAVKSITCGPDATFRTNSTTFMAIPNLYDHCSAVPPPQPPAGTTALPPPTCAPCASCSTSSPAIPPASSPLVVKCDSNKFTIPKIDVEDIEVSSAEFLGDQTRKCVNAAYDLHVWLLEKAGESKQAQFAVEDGVVVTCIGRGVIRVNQPDPDAVRSSTVIVQAAYTAKCRQFFLEFAERLLAL